MFVQDFYETILLYNSLQIQLNYNKFTVKNWGGDGINYFEIISRSILQHNYYVTYG